MGKPEFDVSACYVDGLHKHGYDNQCNTCDTGFNTRLKSIANYVLFNALLYTSVVRKLLLTNVIQTVEKCWDNSAKHSLQWLHDF